MCLCSSHNTLQHKQSKIHLTAFIGIEENLKKTFFHCFTFFKKKNVKTVSTMCVCVQEWWTHLWLNEGFASWIEYLCVDHCFPEYDIWTQFVSADYTRALDLDALDSSHPIEVSPSVAIFQHLFFFFFARRAGRLIDFKSESDFYIIS